MSEAAGWRWWLWAMTLTAVLGPLQGCGAEPVDSDSQHDGATDSPILGFVDTLASDSAAPDSAHGDADGSDGTALDSTRARGQDAAGDAAVQADAGSAGGDTDPGSADATAAGSDTEGGGAADTAAGPPLPCGDGVCSDLEVIPSCAIDCDPMSKQVWSCAANSCTGQRSACAADASCMSAWQTTMLCMKACGFQASCVALCSKELAVSVSAKALGACALPGCMATGGSCGDGTCQATEDTLSCPADCVGADPCGNGTCDATESPQSCPADCASGGGGCGDETCGGGENTTTCPLDCEPDAAKAWSCMQSKCGSEKSACQADSSCLAALNEAAICLKNCGGGSSCAQQCQGPVVGNSKALSLGICALQQCQTP